MAVTTNGSNATVQSDPAETLDQMEHEREFGSPCAEEEKT